MGDNRRIDAAFVATANAFLRREFFRQEDIGRTLADMADGPVPDASAQHDAGDGAVGFRWTDHGVTYERALSHTGNFFELIWDDKGSDFIELTPKPFDAARETEWVARKKLPPNDMAIDPRRVAALMGAVFGFNTLYDRFAGRQKFPTQLSQSFRKSNAKEDRKLLDEAMELFSSHVLASGGPVDITNRHKSIMNLLLKADIITNEDVEVSYFVDRYPSASEQGLSYFVADGDGVIGVVNVGADQQVTERALWPDGTYRRQTCNPTFDTCQIFAEQKKMVVPEDLVILSVALFGFQSLTDDQWKILKLFKGPQQAQLDAALEAFGAIPEGGEDCIIR